MVSKLKISTDVVTPSRKHWSLSNHTGLMRSLGVTLQRNGAENTSKKTPQLSFSQSRSKSFTKLKIQKQQYSALKI